MKAISAIKDTQAHIDTNRMVAEHVHGLNSKITAGMLGGAGLLGIAALLGSRSGASQPAAPSNPLQYEADYYH